MRHLLSTSRLPTAPQGNVTQASHKYVTNRAFFANVTKTYNSGEAEL
jgi:hypothetical protein